MMTTYQEINAAARSHDDSKVRYTAKTHTSGGRGGGVSRSDDGRLDVKFSAPGVPGTGTNPEQLFAAGWSACFISAMGVVANKMKVKLPADAATLSSATWKARRTTCGSRARISSLTKMCAASFLKYRTLLWERKRFACGRARLRQMMVVAGVKSNAEPGPRKR